MRGKKRQERESDKKNQKKMLVDLSSIDKRERYDREKRDIEVSNRQRK